MDIIGIFNIIMIFIIALIPIMVWAYIFSYMDNTQLNARRFIIWMIAWSFSVIPVLYIEEILNYFWLEQFNIFSLICNNSIDYINIWLSIVSIIAIVSVFMFISGLFIKWYDWITRSIYIKNSLILLLIVIIYIIITFITSKIWFLQSWLQWKWVEMWKLTFNTLTAIILYYFIIWLLEEMAKHFWFLTSSFSFIDSIKKWVVYATFIALWFWFVENILYAYNIVKDKGIWTSLFSLIFFRSIFSIFVHIFCSAIVAKIFYEWYKLLIDWKISKISYIKIFLFAFLYSIFAHSVYDISLTLGFTLIVFIYFLFWYLYITKIFYQET